MFGNSQHLCQWVGTPALNPGLYNVPWQAGFWGQGPTEQRDPLVGTQGQAGLNTGRAVSGRGDVAPGTWG